ncbi:MAG: trehalose-phosphatase [Bacteriovoracaceae bacterium]|nr:trehalose-phosphatase [Bacteriovoracaceae bacterium]
MGHLGENNLKAFIFDLDGVLTETHDLHAKAWERMFNEFLLKRRDSPHADDEILDDFDPHRDYQEFLDGKPRFEGVRGFLTSRNIHLNEGTSLDDISANTIQGLGLKKNTYYQKILEREGPHLIQESFSFIQKLKDHGIPMAVVSSSMNCRLILNEAEIDQYFQVIVDPQVAGAKNLKGKPSPDYFLEASRELHLSPEECAVVEDSLAGIKSGRKGHFKKVYGINIYKDQHVLKRLKDVGADQVVSSLWEINEAKDFLDLPDAKTCFEAIFPHDNKENYFLFLDFDGTLSPIVLDPNKARPLEGISELIHTCSQYLPVCIITGRDTGVIKKMLSLPQVYYAACHGFEISGQDGYHYELKEAHDLIPLLDDAQLKLTKELGPIEDLLIERKKFGLAFHYRMIKSPADIATIREAIRDYCFEHPSLRYMSGEAVIEILPRLNWDKGKAILKLYDVLHLDPKQNPPLYFGDGRTDEDAFREMRNWGVPILASMEKRPSLARYHLKGPEEIKKFLKMMCDYFQGDTKNV